MAAKHRPRKIDQVLRAALWEAHGRRCVYDHEPITLTEMEVDHVLPEALWRSDPRLDQYLVKLGLTADYHPDSLDNLLPVRRPRNRQKRDWVFDENSVRFFRNLAAIAQPKVEELCDKFERDASDDGVQVRVAAMCAAADESLRQKLLAVLASTPPFPVCDSVSDREFKFGRPRVMIQGKLPHNEEQGSATVRINTLYLHAVDFHFDGKEVLLMLLAGWSTSYELGQRSFIVSRAQRPDEWIVRLGGALIILTVEELRQLCEVADLLAPAFLRALQRREADDETLAFEPDGPRNVRLMRVKRSLWRAIQVFSHEHDYANGSSPWHIFDAAGWGHIKLVRREGEAITPFETYVYSSSPEREIGGPTVEPEDEAYLCWEETQSRIFRSGERADRGWTAMQTFRWLAETLIPEMVRRASTVKRSEFEMWRTAGDPPKYFSDAFVESRHIFEFEMSWSGLAKFTDAVQEFYIDHSNEAVPRPAVASALAGVGALTAALPVADEHLNYIAEKIRANRGNNVREVIADGARRMLNREKFTASDVDHVFRCAHAILCDHAEQTNESMAAVPKIVAQWEGLVTATRLAVVRQRTIYRLNQPEYL